MKARAAGGRTPAAVMHTFDPGPEDFGVAPAWTRLWADTRKALDESGVRYCVLRDPGADPGRSRRREIDLLADDRDLANLERAVIRLGYVPLAAWGHGGHRFYVAFEDTAGEWLKLDVVTRLRFGGRTRPYSTAAFAGALQRRRRADETWRLDVVDATLALILHGVLDKRTIKEDHRRELLRSRAAIDADEALTREATERFETALGGALSWAEAGAAIAGERWDLMLARRRRIARALARREPLRCGMRWLGGELARLARPALVATGRRGLSVALLGPDGAGKTSLARALAEDAQIRARIVYMGSNLAASTVGLPTTRWIESRSRRGSAEAGGEGLKGVGYVNRLLEQGFRSLVALGWTLRGRFVIFDRHPHELFLAEPPRGAGARIRRWLLQVSSTRPDLVLVLDAPAEILKSRKNEHSLERIERQRQRYRSLPLGRNGLHLDVSASHDQIVRRAKSVIWARYLEHLGRSV